MILEQTAEVPLPAHDTPGGFDHAAVHGPRGQLYVAHTANNAVDVIDCSTHAYLGSISGLEGVAGALVCEDQDLVFTSNRGEDTVGIFPAGQPEALAKVKVGLRPNGLAYDADRRLLLAANVGVPASPGSFTVSMVDVDARAMIANVPVAGRTRWVVFDPGTAWFYVNIADPPQIAVVDATNPGFVARTFAVPSAGPHGLDLDVASRRLFCACDAGRLLEIDADAGTIRRGAELAGVPDVIFFNPTLERLYVAVGDPGVIEVFDTRSLRRVESIVTEKDAHTLAFDAARNLVYALLPGTHRAAVYVDRG